MKKHTINLVIFLAILYLPNIGFAQNCNIGTATATLDVNNAKVKFNNTGSFINAIDGAAYQFPNPEPGTPEVNGIFAASLWMSGRQPNGDLKVSAPTFGGGELAPGALDANGELFDENTCTNWDRMFEVSKTSIGDHIFDFNANGQIDNIIPTDVLLWPGRENPNFMDAYGFDLENYPYDLAPFWDENGDGIYNPQDGDYPDINEADGGIWWMVNDVGTGNENPMRMVTQYLAFGYDNGGEIGNATYVSAKMIYLGQEILTDSYVSLWVDADLGCHTDDYVGSIPDRQMGYVYNADAQDGENGCDCQGVNTYCDLPPWIGFRLLDGVFDPVTNEDKLMTSFMAYNNGGIGNPQPGTTDPNISDEIYNYMSGNWRDSTPLTTGGTGYNPGSTDFTDFAFPYDFQNTWTMCGEELEPSDPRILLNSGPYELQPGAINEFVFAIFGTENDVDSDPCFNDLSPVILTADFVNAFYLNEITSTKESYLPQQSITVFPNPMTESTTFDFTALESNVDKVELYSVDGKLVKEYYNINEQLVISKNNLQEGMYFYKVYTDEQQLVSGKLMVL